ncbi:hypothetical protein [Sanyastnella coralliicola]|uniref:hypothetical protein n=1 Tax=Sanyastnella coralliicola TaxID=3069118 RepID=UPI003D9C7C03
MPDHIHFLLVIDGEHLDKNGANQFGHLKEGMPKAISVLKATFVSKMKKKKVQFAWQRGFYSETIFRKQRREQVSKYIRDNPKNWSK